VRSVSSQCPCPRDCRAVDRSTRRSPRWSHEAAS
jgi:hypothetical protein